MKILVYSSISEQEIEGKLGLPEYSYYFAMREFLPCLREIGDVVVIENPTNEVDGIYEEAKAAGDSCVFLSFTPPHKTETGLSCPTVCAFAWEFSKIPDESWEENDRNNWAKVLEQLGAAITHSSFAESAVREAVGSDIKVTAIPSPVWDKFASVREAQSKEGDKNSSISIALEPVVDSEHFDADQFDPLESAPSKSAEYTQYAVSVVAERDRQLEERNTEFAKAKALIDERDEQLKSANKEREYSEAIVAERDVQLGQANAEKERAEAIVAERDEQLKKANSEREYSESIVAERDQQLEELKTAREYAESIVRERDEQLLQRNKDCEHAESIVRERDKQLAAAESELLRQRSTLIGRFNAWLLRKRD